MNVAERQARKGPVTPRDRDISNKLINNIKISTHYGKNYRY